MDFDRVDDVSQDPLSQAIIISLHHLPNLTHIQSILTFDMLRAGHFHPNLEMMQLLSLDSEPDAWAMLFEDERGRREKALTISPVQMLAFEWGGDEDTRVSWTEWKGGSTMAVPVGYFIEQTAALNIVTPVITLYGLAQVPVPHDSALATTRIPSLRSLDLVGVDLPTTDFIESIEAVVVAQRPEEYFAIRLATAHPVPTSLVAFGQLPSFRQLVKIMDVDRIGHGQVTIEIRRADEEGLWDVVRLSLGVDGGEVVPRFITSLGAELKNLSRLEIAASSDPSSQLEIKWPKDWVSPHMTRLKTLQTFRG